MTWVQMLSEWHAEGLRTPLVRDGQDFSICAMMRELNKRLDDWANLWAWNGETSEKLPLICELTQAFRLAVRYPNGTVHPIREITSGTC